MQRGYIYQHRNCWYLRFYDSDFVDGQRVRKQKCRKLAPVNDEFPTKRSVWSLAEKIIAPVNDDRSQPESALRVAEFIEKIYLPHVKQELRASTYKDYKKDVFEKHIKKRLGGVRLRDFRTVNAQRLMSDIASANDIGHKTLQRIKSFLSGTFKHAKRQGILDGENPIRDVAVPGRAKKFQGEFYEISEIERMLVSAPEPARTVIGLAALTGLRLSEIRGLRWSDYDGESLKVSRSIWRTTVQAPKTDSSAETVPVLPLLQRALQKHRARVKPTSEDAYIFAGERRGAPLNLANLARRVIVPALQEYHEKNPNFPEVRWKGWHSFRRGLASNLYSMRVQPKIIQAIMRHSDIGTTLEYYVQTPDEETREAIEKIEECFPFGL